VRKREDGLKKNNKPYDIKIYLGAKHAFRREGPNYDGEAVEDSRGRTIGGLISAFLPW
ncbi:MAG: dienelactone hydrolase family protein, partial [Proteobacteria bacterium]|nr:dienelactone hydrolase family protein [Pseudomonadota bacterium]